MWTFTGCPPCSSPKEKGTLVAERRRSTSPGRGSDGFMADARRPLRRDPPPPRSRSSPVVDDDGFTEVVNKRRLRAANRPGRRTNPPRRPIPADLVGRCFNCLAHDHVGSQCTRPSRCLRCEEEGHAARNCKRPRFPGPPRGGRGCPVRRARPAMDTVVATRSRGVGRSAASASTASSGSASTGRPFSGAAIHLRGLAGVPRPVSTCLRLRKISPRPPSASSPHGCSHRPPH